jgi:adenylosuccinate synthase
MPKKLILFSGHVASGKSTLAATLEQRYGFVVVKTHDLIAAQTGASMERAAIMEAGEALDRATKGKWLRDAVTREVQKLAEDATVIIDSVRVRKQCDELRRAFGNAVVHVHLTASREVLSERYVQGDRKLQELKSYEELLANTTEAQVETLQAAADIVINTEQSTLEDVVVRAASRLGLYGRGIDRLVDVLVGGQWGSEGKGNVAGYLAPEYEILVRVGGPNAGHKVYQEPEPAKFYHLPSGTERAPNAKIVLGPGSVLWLPTLQEEIARCQLGVDRLRIDPRALMIENEDREFEEKGLKGAIGSTAQGVGAATARKVLRTSAQPPVRLAQDVPELKPYLYDTLEILDRAYTAGTRIFLEGTQGTGLSLHHADYPYVTSRDTTVSGCLADAGIAPSRVRRIVMVCRTYPIRVQSPKDGTSGPMGKEISFEIIATRAGLNAKQIAEAEVTTRTKRPRRVAEFSWSLLRRATSLNGPTDIALSFSDYLSSKNTEARRFDQLTQETIQLIEEIERVASAPVSLVVTRFAFRNIIDRRFW